MAKKKTPAQPTQTFRVIRLAARQKQQYRSCRDSLGLNNKEVLRRSIEEELPALIDIFADLGIASLNEDASPCRLPFEEGSLAALRQASDDTHIPAVLLLKLCLQRFIERNLESAPRRRGRPSKKGGK